MLILSRRRKQAVHLTLDDGRVIRVIVTAVGTDASGVGRVKLGFEAGSEIKIKIDREEPR